MEYSKIIVAAVIVLNSLFAAATLACYWHTGSEPTVLVGAWFTFTTGELWALSSIKKCKQKAEVAKAELTKGEESND